MPASSLVVVAVAAALQPPAGFQSVPIDGKTQVMVARKGDVYFVVRDLPGVLSASARPAAVAARLVTEATAPPRASWVTVGGVDVIRFTWGDAELGANGMIGAHGSKTRVATCQWGVGLQHEEGPERQGAIEACKRALAQVTGFEAPPATGGGEALPPAPDLPFPAPPGFEWRSDEQGGGGWLGLRGGDPETGGGEGMGVYEAPFVFDPKMDVSRVTDEVSEIVEGLKLESLEVVKAGAVDAIHFAGRLGAGEGSAAVEGYMVPRGRTTLLIFVMQRGAVSPDLSKTLRSAASSVEGAAPPTTDAKPAGTPDAGPGDRGKRKAQPEKKGDDSWKGALIVAGMAFLAVGLSIAMGLGRSRRRRRRSGSQPPPDAAA